MTVVARRFRARPHRSAHETWIQIRDLICHANAKAKAEFDLLGGQVASLISDEVLRNHPIVVIGSGARLRIYCLYDEDAIGGDEHNEAPLTWNPLSVHDWLIHLPCPKEDVAWMKRQIDGESGRFIIYDPSQGILEDEVVKSEAEELTIDAEAFRKL